MMSEREFYKNIENNIREYLPASYAEAEIFLTTQIKTNDIEKTGIQIRLPEQRISPVIYLSSFYEQYTSGRTMESILEEIARTRTKDLIGPLHNFDPAILENYDNVRPRLQMRAFDTEKNKKRLEEIVHHSFGDYSAGYSISLSNDPEQTMCVMVTQPMLEQWGITKKTLHEDTIQADLDRTPTLTTMEEMMKRMNFLGEPINYLDSTQKWEPDLRGEERHMFVLSNREAINGAGLILNPVIQQRIAEVVEGNYYVLPSSVHEVLIVPDEGNRELINAADLSYMVHEINQSVVAPADILSDKVQYYDAAARTLNNAVTYEREHEVGIGMERGKVL